MPIRLKSIFNARTFDRTFVRQRDDFSCAAACCATIARLYGLSRSKDLAFFRRELNVSMNGTPAEKIEKICREHLPAEKTGVNVYKGGVALGFIVHKPDGDDHVVVFLARRDKTLIYYDPVEHKIYRDTTDNMQRARNTKDPCKTWTANFPEIEGADFEFWSKRAEDNPYKLREQGFWLKDRGKDLKL